MGVYKIGKKWYIDLYNEGRRVRKVVGSKKDAVNAITVVKADILRGEYKLKRERKIRFDDFAKEYLEYAKVNKKSWRRDETSLKNLMNHFKGMHLLKITPRHIEDYKRERVKQVKPATVNRELALFKFMFSLARKWKLVDENPVKEVKFFQEQKIEMHILDIKKINQLLEASGEYLNAIITLGLNTGMRKGEILSLRWSDIDFDKHFIFIKETKSAKSRKVPMNSLVADSLKKLKRESDFVFYNPKTRECIKDVKTAFKAACRRAGINDLRFHDLRHTSATFMVMGGVDLVTVKEILGHSSIEMTMRYAHPTPENKRKAVNVLATIFEQRGQREDIIRLKDEIRLDRKEDLTPSISTN